jgi:DNA-binding transcriptional LysR family regulator
MTQINLNHLRVFSAVVKHGGYSAAARQLLLSQPTVYSESKAFERWCGVPLFRRVGRGIELTEQGRVISDLADRFFELVDELETTVEQWKPGCHTRVSIGAGPIIGVFLLPAIMRRMRQLYPRIQVVLHLANGEEIERKVLNKELDIGFLGKSEFAAGLDAVHYIDDELVLLVPASHPLGKRREVSVLDLDGQPFIVPELGTNTRKVIETFIGNPLRQAGLQFLPVLEANDPEFIKRAIAQGIGISLVSVHTLTDGPPPRIRRVELLEGPIRRPFWMIYRSGSETLPGIAALKSMLEKPMYK